MLEQPEYAWKGTDADLRALVAAHPWVTMVSSTSSGLTVSHLPILPDPPHGAGPLDVVGHLARDDAEQHELGSCDVVIIVQGPHGYISASWYVGGPYVPTWNYVVAHLHGRPSILTAADTRAVLDRTVDHFESARPEPFRLDHVAAYAARIAPHVTGFRLRPSRLVTKAKLSQDKPATDVAAVLTALDTPDDVHHNPTLARAMRAGGEPA